MNSNALFTAIYYGNINDVRHIIDNCQDTEPFTQYDETGKTPLMAATDIDNIQGAQIFQILLQHDVVRSTIRWQTNNDVGMTALHYLLEVFHCNDIDESLYEHLLECVYKLLSLDPTLLVIYNGNGRAAIHDWAKYLYVIPTIYRDEYIKHISQLPNYTESINLKTKNNERTIVHLMIEQCSYGFDEMNSCTECLKIIPGIEQIVNQPDKDGITPLIRLTKIASWNMGGCVNTFGCELGMLRTLVQRGACTDDYSFYKSIVDYYGISSYPDELEEYSSMFLQTEKPCEEP